MLLNAIESREPWTTLYLGLNSAALSIQLFSTRFTSYHYLKMALALDQKSLGFQYSDFDWNKYMKCRPVYPPSLYARIYNHHSAARPDNAFHTVHDAGAGAGIASERLAERFAHVIVSQPNTEYIQMAEKRLSSLPHQFPTDKFTYRNERAEKSGIRTESMDCVTICGGDSLGGYSCRHGGICQAVEERWDIVYNTLFYSPNRGS